MILPYQYVFLWALLLSFLVALIYRLFTKPEQMRQIKADMKLYREKSKEAQKQKDLKKANEYMSEMMKLSQKQMRQTMKPMFITLGVVLILIGFINQAYSGVAVETKAVDATTALGQFSYADFSHQLRAEKINETDIIVTVDANANGDFTDDTSYANGQIARLEGINWQVAPQSLNVTKMDTIVMLPFSMPFLGSQLTWIMWYILVSLPGTWMFRKALGVE